MCRSLSQKLVVKVPGLLKEAARDIRGNHVAHSVCISARFYGGDVATEGFLQTFLASTPADNVRISEQQEI